MHLSGEELGHHSTRIVNFDSAAESDRIKSKFSISRTASLYYDI